MWPGLLTSCHGLCCAGSAASSPSSSASGGSSGAGSQVVADSALSCFVMKRADFERLLGPYEELWRYEALRKVRPTGAVCRTAWGLRAVAIQGIGHNSTQPTHTRCGGLQTPRVQLTEGLALWLLLVDCLCAQWIVRPRGLPAIAQTCISSCTVDSRNWPHTSTLGAVCAAGSHPLPAV